MDYVGMYLTLITFDFIKSRIQIHPCVLSHIYHFHFKKYEHRIYCLHRKWLNWFGTKETKPKELSIFEIEIHDAEREFICTDNEIYIDMGTVSRINHN